MGNGQHFLTEDSGFDGIIILDKSDSKSRKQLILIVIIVIVGMMLSLWMDICTEC